LLLYQEDPIHEPQPCAPEDVFTLSLSLSLSRQHVPEIFRRSTLEQVVTAPAGVVTRVLLDATNGERTWTTIGVSSNIIEASWQALADSLVFGLLHPPQ
jgi:LeuA allosteric (dimerisation) domain